MINLWDTKSYIKVITDWNVSIEPSCLNKISKILKINTKISSNYGEYNSLMEFLTNSGMSLLDLIDLKENFFNSILEKIYKRTNTSYFKEVLVKLNKHYHKKSNVNGRNTIRYLLLNLREEIITNVLPRFDDSKTLSRDLLLSKKCYPFEKNPFVSNLFGSNTSSQNNIRNIIEIAGISEYTNVKPYLKIENLIRKTGEIFFDVKSIGTKEEITSYNSRLDNWELDQGYKINIYKDVVSIDSYEKTTYSILEKLIELSKIGNKGQKEFNQAFLKKDNVIFTDDLKKNAIKNIFVDSQVLLIYGAAGTGKTTLINYISNLMSSHKKLFLTKTHTAKQNLKRLIDNPGVGSDFISIDSFTKKIHLPDYDVIFVDECSNIDNRTMYTFLSKIKQGTFLVLAGDIYQIESIEFGNWFIYAKDIIDSPGANIELLNTWRTKDLSIISLWDEVRKKGNLITEKLVIDGPFSDNIGKNIFEVKENDEVILCLNYDGKFGLNNMNSYFQNKNSSKEAISWREWRYKEGDSILFNDSQRFETLYNNLKGKIVKIDKTSDEITFTIDVATNLTKNSCEKDGIEFVDAGENFTRIRFTVYEYDASLEDDENARMLSVVPFHLAYAVSIHKAQGLEYESVKVIIPKSTSERITHGIFYTAITRAKKSLKIYWSSETMNEIVKSFYENEQNQKSLTIIKNKLFGIK
ncbi:MAG: ATP-dependent DNA helicase [Erysipelotrichaceae bacterium]